MPLKRSYNKMIAGVCAGIAEWLGWDPTLVRVGYVLFPGCHGRTVARESAKAYKFHPFRY